MSPCERVVTCVDDLGGAGMQASVGRRESAREGDKDVHRRRAGRDFADLSLAGLQGVGVLWDTSELLQLQWSPQRPLEDRLLKVASGATHSPPLAPASPSVQVPLGSGPPPASHPRSSSSCNQEQQE